MLAQGVEPYLGINSLEAIRDLKMECEPPKEHEQYNQILSTLSESSNPHTISSLSELLKINEQLLMNELFDLELNGRIIIRGNVVKKYNSMCLKCPPDVDTFAFCPRVVPDTRCKRFQKFFYLSSNEGVDMR